MNASLLAVLNDTERLLIAETEKSALAELDEDGVVALHMRVRTARNKYVGQYRRGASARVRPTGGRGHAYSVNERARTKAEAFEGALARVSQRLAVLAKESAAQLKAERLDAARGSAQATGPGAAKAASKKGAPARNTAKKRTRSGDRDLRSPVREKNRAGTQATQARKQAKRDSR